MNQGDKLLLLKQEIKNLQSKLDVAIKEEQNEVNSIKALKISKELDELIVKYYDDESK